MALTSTLPAERRRFPRRALPVRFVVQLLRANGSLTTEGINFSEGGLCLRLREALDVRSAVQLRLTPLRAGDGKGCSGARAGAARDPRPVTCAGRVSWVIQRLDLRDHPPFVFDAGIEFVNPPPMLQHLVRRGVDLAAQKRRSTHQRLLEPFLTRGRDFVPRLERTSSRPPRWHLVVSVGGVPCFSAHYPSERAAIAAWARFKREQPKH